MEYTKFFKKNYENEETIEPLRIFRILFKKDEIFSNERNETRNNFRNKRK